MLKYFPRNATFCKVKTDENLTAMFEPSLPPIFCSNQLRQSVAGLQVSRQLPADIPDPANYYVFFSIKTVKPDNDAKFIKISVESAYLDADAKGTKSPTFSQALGEVWAGRPNPRKKKN